MILFEHPPFEFAKFDFQGYPLRLSIDSQLIEYFTSHSLAILSFTQSWRPKAKI